MIWPHWHNFSLVLSLFYERIWDEMTGYGGHFLQCGDHSQSMFFGDNKQYLLDPVCIFIVLVNYVLASFVMFYVFLPRLVRKLQGLSCVDLFLFVLYLPDMALWTKGTFQKDLTQVFETQTSNDFQQVHLTLSYSLNSVQTEGEINALFELCWFLFALWTYKEKKSFEKDIWKQHF